MSLNWLIRGRVAVADDISHLPAPINTALLLGCAARGPAMGRSASGHWIMDHQLRRASRPALHEIQRVVDFLRYEHEVGRVVAIVARPAWLAQLCVECLAVAEKSAGRRKHPLAAQYERALRRDGEERIRRRGVKVSGMLGRVLVHTTSVDAMPGIVRDGALRSTASMTGGAPSIGAIFFKEPDDYAEYVMLNSPGGFRGGINGEIVVNSRRIGEFWSHERARDGDYVPGVRMYFSRRRLESHPAVCYDGVHGLKIRGWLDLVESLLAIATADRRAAQLCRSLHVPVLHAKGKTPERYVAEADRLFVAAVKERGEPRAASGEFARAPAAIA
jgi:hypothetical protein